jgi:hypothetical protein
MNVTLVSNFEAFTAVMFQVEVFWVVTSFSFIVGYLQHHQNTTRRHNPEDLDQVLVVTLNTQRALISHFTI